MASRQRAPRRPAQRPEQILDAAQQLLAAGAADLNMDLVAEAAGLSKGTLYHYYAAKTDLLDALRQRYLERSVVVAADAAAADAPTVRRLEMFIQALLNDAVANGPLVWALFHDTGTTGNAHLAIVGDALRDLVRAGVAAGDITVSNADIVASFFAHGFFGLVRDAFDSGALHPAELATELTTLLQRMLVEAPARVRRGQGTGAYI